MAIQNNLPDQNQVNQPGLGATQGAGSSAGSTGSSPTGDHALYMAMVAMSNELGTLAKCQTSVAELSSALYKNMVPNSTNMLKKMQQNLDDYTWAQKNYSAIEMHFNCPFVPAGMSASMEKAMGTAWVKEKVSSWQANHPMPALDPGMSAGDMKTALSFYKANPGLTAMRTSIGTYGQVLNSQNSVVQEIKIIPDTLQQQVKTLENSQTQFSSMIPSLVGLMKAQFNQSW